MAIILAILINLACITSCHAWNPLTALFGGGGPKLDLSKKVTELTDVQNEMKAGINDVSMDMKDLIKMNVKMNADIKASLEANVKAVAGLDKSVNAGRDVITNTKVYNDPTLLKYMIGTLASIIFFLMKGSRQTKKWMMKALDSKRKWRDKYIQEHEKNQKGAG